MYVIINGVNSDTIRGLQILSLPPITKPKMRTSVATIDGRPGDIVTYLGYEAYNKTIKILLHGTYDLPAIMAYFNQSGTIIFSNDPDKIYTFETIEQINYERAVKFKTASVTIHVQPYKLSATEEPATGEVSTLVDRTPYIIRRTPFGTRQKGTIVGGSVVWNQLIENGDFADGIEKWNTIRATSSAADGVLTGTCNAAGTMYLMQNHASSQVGHVCLVCVDYMPSVTGTIACSITRTTINTNSAFIDINVVANQWVHKEVLARPDTDENGGSGFRIGYTTSVAVGDTLSIKNVMLIDLTLMFGPTIADYIYTQEQASAGVGPALAKVWAGIVDDYCPYDAGTIKSVTGMTAHKTTGFNQWDEEWENGYISTSDGSNVGSSATHYRSKNYIRVLPSGVYYFLSAKDIRLFMYREDLSFIDYKTAFKNALRTLESDCCYIRFDVPNGGNHEGGTVCINLSDPSKNGTYEPYTAHEYPLDSSLTLQGLPVLDGDKLYYDGDIYPPSGEVERRYGVVDLGTLNWSYNNADGNQYFFANVAGKAIGNFNILCDKYALTEAAATSAMTDNEIKGHATSRAVFIKDSAYTDAAAFKTAMSGAYLVYELAEPTTETAEPYTALQICDPAGTEEFVGANMPVGHDTAYIDPISVTVTNEGNTESAPSITIEGEGAVEVTVDGLIAFEINMPTTGTITIDSKAMDATDGDGNLANRSVSGDYTNLQLAPGEHTVVVVGDVSNVTMKNVSRWL